MQVFSSAEGRSNVLSLVRILLLLKQFVKTHVCTFGLYVFNPREYNFLNEQLLKAALMKQTKGCPTSCLSALQW